MKNLNQTETKNTPKKVFVKPSIEKITINDSGSNYYGGDNVYRGS